jgi:aminomethyltransferase
VDQDLKILPLRELHEQAGAKFAAFAGWSMPISYPAGVMKEHLHTREAAGLFDISHMQLFDIAGPDAAQLIERCCPLDASMQQIGTAKYTFLLNRRAGIIDDLIVTRRSGDRFLIVANASRADVDLAHISSRALEFDCSIKTMDRVFLALQGPKAADVINDAGISAGNLPFMSSMGTGQGWIVNRSGYTGEDGFEIALPIEQAKLFAEKLLADDRVMWIGLAARDSLRLEAGLCLYGQDLTEEIDPASARLMWAVPKVLRENGTFNGAEALSQILQSGAKRVRVGILPEGRQPVRGGTVLYNSGGDDVGLVTSGGFGPSAGMPVAMGYVDKALSEPSTALEAEVRGKRVPVTISRLPFVPHRYYREKTT